MKFVRKSSHRCGMTFLFLTFAAMSEILLSTAYLAPVQYYTKLAVYEKAKIEQFESYQKQTYRNRCRILGGNGPIDLTIPVVKNSGAKTLLKDVKIENLGNWQMKHWRTIVSAFNSSPFFEYYVDDFQPFFERSFDFLLDFNQELNEVLLELLELDVEIELTSDFIKNPEITDYRTLISPKSHQPDLNFNPVEYTQTFHDRFGFVPNLSVIDLLFNVGPESGSILIQSFSK